MSESRNERSHNKYRYSESYGRFVHHATWTNAGAYPKLAGSK